jgi:glycosyltransferase involved in cell wall biosynthesis
MMNMTNKTSEYQFTIIVPVYNEEANMPALERAFTEYLPTASMPACVLFVNDGSVDASLSFLREMCARHTNFFYISFARNAGLSAAIKAGIDYCESPYVGYIDADLQTSPEDFNLLLAEAPDHELVTGIRVGRKDTRWKRIQSRIANRFRRMMTGDTAQDTGCPLKVLHTDVARRIPFFRGMHRFLPALVMLQEGRVAQIPVRHFPRVAGKSKFSFRNRSIGPFMDCFAFRWMKSRYIRYDVEGSNL